ncbi:MAG: hypothetical protein ACYC5K_06900 [Saccharofermentanales bacterium]
MKRILSVVLCIGMLTSLFLAAPSVFAATTGYWIDRTGAELNEPYEEAKDATYEPIPGSITSSGAFGIAGATFSKPIGKTAFKLSFDLDWVAPKRFSDAADSTAIKNFFIYVNYTYTGPNEMAPWGGFSSAGPWETWSDGNFLIYANKTGIYPIGESISSGGKVVTTSIVNIEEGLMNLPKQGTITVTLELKNNVVSMNLKAEDGTNLGTATATYEAGFFSTSKTRYFAITHFNGAFVFDITNFKIISSDIPDSVGATATSRPAVESSAVSSAASSSKASSAGTSSAASTGSTAASTESGASSTDISVESGESTDSTVSSEASSVAAGSSSVSTGSSKTSSASSEEPGGNTNRTLAIVLIAVAAAAIIGAGVFYFIKRKR